LLCDVPPSRLWFAADAVAIRRGQESSFKEPRGNLNPEEQQAPRHAAKKAAA
jgi:hypothetical protein